MTPEPSIPTVVSIEAPLYAVSLGLVWLVVLVVLVAAVLAAVVVRWRRRARSSTLSP